MSSEFPGRPWLLKGALVVFGVPIPVPTNIIIFQYNPESMTRRLRQGGADQNPGVTANVRIGADTDERQTPHRAALTSPPAADARWADELAQILYRAIDRSL
jgi:hypothetical protein